ncbi:TetR/AcrR family transcriptional regulator [Desulfosporosinus sp.]|uniref:TetR/AcrR family transcriptional regulator n=1 Tax=Desulfosporosinus sp. TaxID=157907 RepID=UPI000E8C0674|nr:TetR/AcrR family transcriptional regulator [Desulfosporosinus sp.]MBC2721991.1 TetR/AcrR family transcriptional regulator [Desulfosporosinus sp.]MBC2725007.1 TetR/AcrR family transcriptional regulator [Desulfosporosinus sp.]HBV86371.1 TetR/AcrR family transcriptional regulator [Desulfosporosinus sp.]
MLVEMNRREKKKLQTKKTIAEIALTLYFKKGLNETTVAEIMEKAALGTGTFYNYFESKEAILKYCLAERIDKASQTCEDIQSSMLNSTQKLTQILQVIGKTHDENRQLISLYMKFYHNSDKVNREPPHGNRFMEILSNIILEGRTKNEFRKDIPPEIINEMFSGILKTTMSSDLKLSFMDNINFKYSLLLEGVIKREGEV